MANLFTGWHLIALLFVILLLFGAPKLPALAKSLGQSMKILRKEVSTDKKPDAADEGTDAPADTAVSSDLSPEEELARAKAEAAAAKAEAEALRAAAQKRNGEGQ